MIYLRWFSTLIFVSCLSAACGGSSGTSHTADSGGPTSRGYALGFTDFPHANSVAAVNEAFAIIARDGDMAVMHFDDGVPWQEALDGVNHVTPYTQNYAADYLASINFKKSAIPSGHVVYLAVTPLSFSRDTLAAHRGNAGNEPLALPWSGYAFDHPDVIAAFGAHCENMIAAFAPDYFAYAIEANMLQSMNASQWPAFVKLAQATYTAIKARHPNLPVFVTLQASFFHADIAGQTAAIGQLLPYTDFIAVSGYPYTDQNDPRKLAVDYFSAVADLAPRKPFAVAETAWPAEDVTSPYPVTIPASPAGQQIYVQRLLQDADELSARFVTLFFTQDFDEFWDSDFKNLPGASLVRLWRDTGLYDGAGNARPALDTWRQSLARPRR